MKKQRDILLISNDRNLRNVGTVMLEIVGYSVHTATNMQDALDILAAESIGLIISGQNLDDTSGIDFLNYLKVNSMAEVIPFIFYIHKDSQADLFTKQAMDLGAVDVILYPGVPDDFIGRIGKFLPSAIKSQDNEPEDEEEDPFADVLPQEKKDNVANQEPPALDDGDVLISLDGNMWTECQVIHHTFHGVMVETWLRGQQGSTIKLCYGMPDGTLMATGRLMHILMGAHEQHTGIGINFQWDSNWPKIQAQMKSAAEEPPPDILAETPTAVEEEAHHPKITPFPPIGIEVSRDGALWMYGEIIEYGGISASITTPVLGKAGETLHIRITIPSGQKILEARIKEVTLNDFKMPAGMEIIFPENEQWLNVIKEFPGDKGDEPAHEKEDVKPAAKKEDSTTDWAATVFDGRKQQKPENIKHRFYKTLIGKKLGNYELASFLNAGSMGGVFKGWDIALERDVAIKVISYELSSQPEFVEMFFKEARLVSKLNHPNIGHIYFIGNETGIVYYAMEFIVGSTLAELIKTRSLQPKKVVAYLIDSCKALDRVWQEKIIHRDIKPENIMISEHEAVKLLDFGVAQQQKIGAIHDKKKIAGTPPYMSPESIRKKPIDFRSDIYSLGATFYHALCGVPPFKDKSLKGLLLKHLKEAPVPLSKKQPSITIAISDVIQKMLAKNPNERFQSYQEIIDALEAEK